MSAGQATRVFILEDDVDQANNLRDILRMTGFRAETFLSVEPALQRLQKLRNAGETFQVFVLDISLPRKNAFEFIVEAGPTLVPPIRIVFLTAWSQMEDFQAQLKMYPFAPRLIKPDWTTEELLQAIEEVLARSVS